jgi:hypothetical protein
MLALLPVFVLTSLLIILTDSLYYGDLTLAKLWELSMAWSDWKAGLRIRIDLMRIRIRIRIQHFF